MTPPKPHHLSMSTIDALPSDVHAEISGGLVDLYADTNNTHHLARWRLTSDMALSLYRRLGQLVTKLPIRLEDTE